MSHAAVVTNIQGYAIHDGPGIRTVVFLKGCPLRCRWCANPENLVPEVQAGFLGKLCQTCGACAGACRRGAILPGPGVYRIDRARCDGCCRCADACNYGALVRYGREMDAEAVFRQVRRDKLFYEESGGGVTVSGGEPLRWPDFLLELFTLCRGEGISTCVETCGFAPWAALQSLLPVTDWFYFDLKQPDDRLHRLYTGQSSAPILENARKLAAAGARLLFRQPLVPGVNDDGESIARTADFLRSLANGPGALQLMPYHRAGLSKYEALAMDYAMAETPVMAAERIEEIKNDYLARGVPCTISR